MGMFLVSLVLAALTFMTISLQKAYSQIPARELKRRARAGDDIAKILFRAVSYGASLRVLLWAIVGLAGGTLFVMWTRFAPWWLALIGSVGVIWVGFAWLPNSRVSALSMSVARVVTPAITWLLNFLAPTFDRFYQFLRRHRPLHIHTGLYQKEDLFELIERQQNQPDSRISKAELDIIRHVLTFGDKLVRDVMVPKRVVKMIPADEHVGPVLLDELHKSGYSRFPVYEGSQEHIVGILHVRDLVNARASGNVSSLMNKSVYFVHDEQPLPHVLQAFLKTKYHLFVVVNAFEEIVGIITIEDVLEQVIGKPIMDEFDKYEDMRAVASLAAAKDHRAVRHAEAAPAEK